MLLNTQDFFQIIAIRKFLMKILKLLRSKWNETMCESFSRLYWNRTNIGIFSFSFDIFGKVPIFEITLRLQNTSMLEQIFYLQRDVKREEKQICARGAPAWGCQSVLPNTQIYRHVTEIPMFDRVILVKSVYNMAYKPIYDFYPFTPGCNISASANDFNGYSQIFVQVFMP